MNIKQENIKHHSEKNFDRLLVVTFFIGILLIASTYAWFASSLDARVNFIDMKVETEGGLYISYDGIDFKSTLELNKDNIITNLKETYPEHMNQWAGRGLYPVSSNGIPNGSTNLFDVYGNSKVSHYFDEGFDLKVINTHKIEEKEVNEESYYLAFDIFLKNISNSPMPDNLFMGNGTKIEISKGDDADGTVNSLRIGMTKVGTAPKNSTKEVIQGLTCENKCESRIYEPNAMKHSEESIARLEKYGVNLFNGREANTLAVVAEGKRLNILNGHIGTGLVIDHEHFAVQNTVSQLGATLFKLPSGISKFRVYIWIEGQDLDSLETISHGTTINVTINLRKDIAGYEYYN